MAAVRMDLKRLTITFEIALNIICWCWLVQLLLRMHTLALRRYGEGMVKYNASPYQLLVNHSLRLSN